MYGPFGRYVIPWYGCELERIEKIKPENEKERFDLLKRVEDLRVEIYDLEDEGFIDLSAEFQKQHRALDRLDVIYQELYKPGDENLLHPLPRADRLIPKSLFSESEEYGEPQPLDEYLERLEKLTFDDVGNYVRNSDELKLWREAALLILKQQTAFAESILHNKFDLLVALLRDMLPQYLISRWKGIPSLALPLSRTYLNRFGNNYDAYDHITGPLYEALEKHPDDFEKMWNLTCNLMSERIKKEDNMNFLAETLRHEFKEIQNAENILVIETGLQATMPLLFEGVFEKKSKWLMFTAAPWLLDIYKERLFCHQYTMLRPCETLFCNEKLFKFCFENNSTYVRETNDSSARDLAYWEIVSLKNLCMNNY
ncbi:MAG TPA: hypothetical protein PK419_06680 [Spirochaetota bacterium]|jgi:hypothetical protein|nr:hypothetical protein [Spirochaetota bacterium]HQA52523.1 hypothetical protein [Spirochaetota bacterium]